MARKYKIYAFSTNFNTLVQFGGAFLTIKYLHLDDLANFFLKIMICPKYYVQDCLRKNFIRIFIDFQKIAFIWTFYRVFSWKNTKLTQIKPIFYKLTKISDNFFFSDNFGQNILEQRQNNDKLQVLLANWQTN